MAGRRRQPAVSRDQSRAELLCKHDIGRIISGQILTELPNPRQQRRVGIASQPKVEQIIDGLVRSVRCHDTFPHQPPQYLRDLKIDEVWSMQRLIPREDSIFDAAPCRCLQQPVNAGGRIEDDHRSSSPATVAEAFFPHEARGIEWKGDWFALLEAHPQLSQSWPFGDLFNFRKQVVRQ